MFDPVRQLELVFAFESPNLHPLRQCSMNLIDCMSHAHSGGAWPLVEKSEVKKDENSNAYLLTNYDVYLTKEPDLMCSMALVHSRVNRIFFCHTDPTKGGIYSVAKLQNISSLNHTFEVYKMTRSDQ